MALTEWPKRLALLIVQIVGAIAGFQAPVNLSPLQRIVGRSKLIPFTL